MSDFPSVYAARCHNHFVWRHIEVLSEYARYSVEVHELLFSHWTTIHRLTLPASWPLKRPGPSHCDQNPQVLSLRSRYELFVQGIVLIVFAAILWGVGDVFSKVAVETASPWLTSLIRSVTFFPIVAIFVLRRDPPRPRLNTATGAAIGAGILVGVSIVATRFALLTYDVSIVSPVKRLSLLVTVTLSLVVLKESLTPKKSVGIVAAIGAVLLLSP